MRALTLFLFFISVTGLLLPLLRHSYWWIRVFDYPKIHLVALSIISIILLIAVWGFNSPVTLVFSGLLLVGLAFTIPRILIYTPLGKVNAKPAIKNTDSDCLRIIQCNIKMDNREAPKVVELVRQYSPDIFLVVEPDHWWLNQLSELDSIYEYSVKNPQENTYGMILYSKFKLTKTEVNFLVKDDIPSIFTTVYFPGGREFNLHCLHPEPPRPGSDAFERDAELLLVGKSIKKTKKPAIVMGDLNDVAWSYTSELFQRYSELLDPREGRGFFNTYNAKIPVFRYPLDHFFYSKDFGLVQLKKLEAVGSDHFPIMMDICLNLQEDHSQNQEQADMEDKKNVEKKIEQGT